MHGRRVVDGGGTSGTGDVDIEDVLAALMVADKEMLVAIILSQATAHPELMHGLLEMAAKAKAEGAIGMNDEAEEFDLDAARRDIEMVFTEYRLGRAGSAGIFAADLVEIAHELTGLVETGVDRGKLLDLIEFILIQTAHATERARRDALRPALSAIAGTYCLILHAALRRPEEQAARLLAVALQGESTNLAQTLARSLRPLSDETVAKLRAQCVASWENAHFADDGADEQTEMLATFILEFASEYRDTDLTLAVLTKDPTTGMDYQAIVQTLQKAGRNDDALAWAERGLAALPLHDSVPIVDYLKGEYRRRGMQRQRTEMMLIDFAHRPSTATYRQLRISAEEAGMWDEMRTRAFETVRALTSAGTEPDATLAVQMLVHDGNIDAAWNEALTAGCNNETWLILASHRSATHPADAIAVYTARIEELAGTTDQESYAEIVRILQLAAPLMEVSEPSFNEYVAELRTLYKRRRTFIGLLDRAFPDRASTTAQE
ncbi:MAG: hypothetical protein JST22_15260 [Bacteroidetes bacterium]|nr:hypothetical protein [Bacteroidota bacterium]